MIAEENCRSVFLRAIRVYAQKARLTPLTLRLTGGNNGRKAGNTSRFSQEEQNKTTEERLVFYDVLPVMLLLLSDGVIGYFSSLKKYGSYFLLVIRRSGRQCAA